MAQIFKHPALEDYFHEVDFGADDRDLAKLATDLYEKGQMFVLRGAVVEFDREFFSQLAFVGDPGFKKMKSLSFGHRLSHDAAATQQLSLKYFGGDSGRLRYFTEQIALVNKQVAGFIDRLFPSYQVIRPSITWRLSETINENLHIDVYNEDLPDHHVRLFVNLDIVPRIWHTSFTLDGLLKQHLGLLDEKFIRTATPGRICHALNFAVFKGFEEAGREGCPKHIAFFDPGEVWVVDSRKVSHQIFFGRKALSTEYAIKPESMTTPTQHYFSIVERRRAEYLESADHGRAVHRSAESA